MIPVLCRLAALERPFQDRLKVWSLKRSSEKTGLLDRPIVNDQSYSNELSKRPVSGPFKPVQDGRSGLLEQYLDNLKYYEEKHFYVRLQMPKKTLFDNEEKCLKKSKKAKNNKC
ncbi:hypothetical protein BpHYR1_012786 [Brachionus plicatilis]|uniref:Uncharacterized protein n=1 Tax=Brachionus plicatilis TaxID=10195 RepID=A0A3M7RMJ4_BRAPC|nr:hypothetical protein BpHYR1_012786 [Brachionus plicatilis]